MHKEGIVFPGRWWQTPPMIIKSCFFPKSRRQVHKVICSRSSDNVVYRNYQLCNPIDPPDNHKKMKADETILYQG